MLNDNIITLSNTKLIALDIDGTLTNDQKEITPVTLTCLIEQEKNGVRLVLASARPTPGLFEMRDKLKMRSYGGILMSYNGGRITDCDGNVLSEISMNIEQTKEILRKLEALPVTVVLDDGKCFYVTDKNGYKVDYECRNNRMTCKEVENLADFLCFAPIKLLLAVNPEKIHEIQEEIKKFLPTDLTVVRTAAFYLEIIPKAIDKGKGITDICKLLDVDIKNCIAFGDSENDIPMLKAAGIGVAMDNAEQAVKECADIVTMSNNEDGIAEVFK